MTTPDLLPTTFTTLRKRLDDAVAAKAWTTVVAVAEAIAEAGDTHARAAARAAAADSGWPRDLNEPTTVTKAWGLDGKAVRRG